MSDVNVMQESMWYRAGAAVRRIVSRHPLMVVIVALSIGMMIGHSTTIFGYSSAEACAAQAQTRWSVGACYELYPSIHDSK